MNYFYIFIISLVLISCNNDDSPSPQNDNPAPIDFILSIDNITSHSAELSWTSAQANGSTSVLYSIYLNNEMIIDDLDQLNYDLNRLNFGELYSVKIIATNEYGNSETYQDFTTLENVTLFLNRYELADGVTLIDYDSNQNISKLTYTGSDYFFNRTSLYTYDNENRLLREFTQEWNSDFKKAEYSYNNNSVQIVLAEGVPDSQKKYEINFNDELSYTLIEYYEDIYPHYVATYNVSISKNSNGDTTNLIILNTDSNIETTFSFEYENNNLIKIIDSENNLFEISYDNSNNFHTYPSGYSNGWAGVSDFASLQLLDAPLIYKLRKFPTLFNHINANNPVQYKKNGSIYRSFDYEYNLNNYPTKISTDGIHINLFYN